MISPVSYKPYNNVVAFQTKNKQKKHVMQDAVVVSRDLGNKGYKNTEKALYQFLISEIGELADARKTNNRKNMEEEVGDIIFDAIMLADYYEIDPERALAKTNQKITKRLQVAEDIAGAPLTEYSHNDRLFFWEQAKQQLRNNKW